MSDNRPRPRFVPLQRVLPRPPPGEEPIVWFDMPDGLRVGLRPLHPDDREALLEGFESLSDDSRYHRFLSPMPRLTERQARYLTEIDQVNHFAWGIGIREQDGSIKGIGVARYVRDAGDPSSAEIAVAIADSFQGRGLGSLLIRALAVVADTHGIERLSGYMLDENRPMVRIFEGLGARFERAGAGLVRAEAHLHRGVVCTLEDEACSELVRIADRAAHPSAQHRNPA